MRRWRKRTSAARAAADAALPGGGLGGFAVPADAREVPAIAAGAGSLWQILFLREAPVSHADVLASDRAAAAALDAEQLRRGLYVLPGIRRFVGAAHGEPEFTRTEEVLDQVCAARAG